MIKLWKKDYPDPGKVCKNCKHNEEFQSIKSTSENILLSNIKDEIEDAMIWMIKSKILLMGGLFHIEVKSLGGKKYKRE